MAHLGARPRRYDQRHHAENEGQGRHQDRPQAHPRGFDHRLEPVLTLFFVLPGEFDNEDRILRRQSDQDDEADLPQNIHRHAAQHQTADGGQQTHGHDQDHGQWQAPAFVLSGEQQEHEHDGRPKNEERGVARLFLLIGELRPLVGVAVGQDLLRQPLHGREPIAARIAGLCRALNGSRGQEVEMLHAVRTGDVAERGNGPERHHLAVGITRLQLGDRV